MYSCFNLGKFGMLCIIFLDPAMQISTILIVSNTAIYIPRANEMLLNLGENI